MRAWIARALLPVALVAGVALSLVPAGPARGGRLLTGFERRGGTSWTSPDEERDFLRALVEESETSRSETSWSETSWSDRGRSERGRSERSRSAGWITVTRIGTSARGRPLELITLTGPSTVPDPIRVLFVCGQHGDEPAGREAGLKLVRDLAGDRSAAGRRLLERVTVLVLPTPNPDGLAAGTRTTADGVDLNRDHVAVSTPEARAISRVLRELRPQVVHDMHEFATPVGNGDAPFLYLWPRNLNVTPALRALSIELARDRMGPALRAAGWQTAVFGTTSAARETAGDADERLLRNIAGVDHAVAVLAEVAATPLSALEQQDAGLLGRRRVAAHTVA
ncbi:M14 family zinc carboxypeptidase, partial [Streptomyces sp. SID3343]|uniref:M14 family zinc carboxypeptidase n=1 Tax=Streptomyces sp. SID3343 TaxID=2690260 RepID=UPI00136A5C80